MIRYNICNELKKAAEDIAKSLIPEEVYNHLSFIVSNGARAKVYARIYGLPKAIQVGHSLPPFYTVEFLCNNCLNLADSKVLEILIHELLHIPKTASGGLRPHGNIVNQRNVRHIASNFGPEKGKEIGLALKYCCNRV